MGEPLIHIALIQPDIPGNTGNIGRLAIGTGARLHLVHPLGFQIDEKAVRRAGIDYWKRVDLQEHADSTAFWSWVGDRRYFLYSAFGEQVYTRAEHQPGDVLIFGCETKGLPEDWIKQHGAWKIPLIDPSCRGLNLSNAVSVVLYEAVRQIRPEFF